MTEAARARQDLDIEPMKARETERLRIDYASQDATTYTLAEYDAVFNPVRLRIDLQALIAEVEFLRAARSRSAEAPAPVTGDTSDGYHTFNELYAYRKAYNALLFNEWAARGLYGVHKSLYHSDGEACFGGGWFIVSAETPAGQITNHYKNEDWALFNVPMRERAAEWDGHTPAVALVRLLALASSSADRKEPA